MSIFDMEKICHLAQDIGPVMNGVTVMFTLAISHLPSPTSHLFLNMLCANFMAMACIGLAARGWILKKSAPTFVVYFSSAGSYPSAGLYFWQRS